MEVSQISIFLENRSGGLADVVDVLARNGVDMKAVSVADMSDFGILRVIVDDAERTRGVLRAAGFTVDKTSVVAVEVPDHPGGLGETLHALRTAGINVEYMYSAARKSGDRAVIIFRFDDVPRALETLARAGVKVLDRFDDLKS
jgi:hypothetical protein